MPVMALTAALIVHGATHRPTSGVQGEWSLTSGDIRSPVTKAKAEDKCRRQAVTRRPL